MITAGMLAFNAAGRIRVITDVIPVNRGLTPTILGVLCYIEEPPVPVNYNNEIGYGLNGSVCAQVLPHQRGEPPSKGLRISTTEPITHYWMGLPMTADGRLAVIGARTMREHEDDMERERALK